MKKNTASLIIVLISIISICLLCLPITAYANSSWHWLTTSPITILPFAVISTLLVETILIVKFGKVKKQIKAFGIVTLANLISFLAPYVERAYRFIPTSGGFRLSAAFNKGPYYIVLAGYLFLTIIIELPVVFLWLKKDTESVKSLAMSILTANIITTLGVALIERIVCVGRW
jgi:hypothetical protein